MSLRPEFIPSISEKTIEYFKNQIAEVEAHLDKENLHALIKKFNEEAGPDFDVDYFRNYWTFESKEDFALKASLPVATRIEDIRKEELIWIVERIVEQHKYHDYYVHLLERNVSDPEVMDLIYNPSARGYDELSPKEIVEIALKYRPIQL